MALIMPRLVIFLCSRITNHFRYFYFKSDRVVQREINVYIKILECITTRIYCPTYI